MKEIYEDKSKISKKELILLLLIIGFGIFLRVYALGIPPLWVDESISASAAKSIINTGNLSFDSGWDYNSSYFLHYLMAFFMLFGKTEFMARFVSVIFGVLTIILAYFIGREYSKKYGGIISAIFFSIFYLEVFFSRQARYYQLFQLAFFASIYFLYKSKENKNWIYPALISMFIAIDTHLEGFILAPLFIICILLFNRKYWFFSVFPLIPLVQRFLPAKNLTTNATASAFDYTSNYFDYFRNALYTIILFVPGAIIGFFKNKRLTLMLLIPSLITLFGVFHLETFAFRYAYFFVFVVLLFLAVLFSFLFEKYGKWMILALLLILIYPSNLIFQHNATNLIKPIDYNLNDYSSPYTNYKSVPSDLIKDMKGNTTLISYFSPDVEFYIKKPDYVLPFSMDGRGYDQISFNNSKGEVVGRYSGALILNTTPEKPYYLTSDAFSVKKLKGKQVEFLKNLTENCSIPYSSQDLIIYYCQE